MTIFLDLAGSFVVRASMFTVMLGLTVTMNNALYESTQQANTKAYVATVADIIYKDLNLAGNNVTGTAFTIANSSQLRFSGDLDNQGPIETVWYYTVLDPTTGFYKVYRQIDSETPLLIGQNFKSISFQYYDVKGVPSTDMDKIRAVRVKVEAQVEGVTQGMTTAVNDFKVYPANL